MYGGYPLFMQICLHKYHMTKGTGESSLTGDDKVKKQSWEAEKGMFSFRWSLI